MDTTIKQATKLSPKIVEAIEKILASDGTVKLTPTKNGISVYREKLKKEYPQS